MGWQQGEATGVENFIELLLPVAGREKRVAFMPLPYWGKKKPPYRDLRWQRYDTQHFTFYAYPEGKESLQEAMRLFESNYAANNALFGVEGRFDRKIPIILYQTREDFEQTHTIGGVISESLGGVTEPFSWKRVVLPFEGERSLFEHVIRHEGTHIYQVVMNPFLPLWFIEGSAETNSIYWDANAETVLRDAYLNNILPSLQNLWQIQGTWLMYKFGNFVCNYLVERYGRESLTRIFQNSLKMNFDSSLKQAIGLDLEQLDRDVTQELHRRFGPYAKRRDLTDVALEIDKGYLLAASGNFFVSGKMSRSGRLLLNINRFEGREGLFTSKVVTDRRLGTESLRQFKGGADLDAERLIYTVKTARNDAIRLQGYVYDAKRRRFTLSKPRQFDWPLIDRITDPTLIDKERFAFIGYVGGYARLFLYDMPNGTLTELAGGGPNMSGLDYSPQRKSLVFAREMERTVADSDYNYDLFLYDLEKRTEKRLMQTIHDERSPRFSPDGNALLFVSDAGNELNIGVYNFDTGEERRITNAKTGFPKAEWAGTNDLYVMSPRKFAPKIFAAPLPTRREVLAMLLPESKDTRKVRLTNFPEGSGDDFSLASSATTTPIEQPIRLGPMRVVDGALVLETDRKYAVEGIAEIENQLYLQTRQKSEPAAKIPEAAPTKLFRLGAAAAEPLSDNKEADSLTQKRFRDKLSSFAVFGSVMQSFLSPNGSLGIVRMNNVLAVDKRSKGPDSSLYIVDVPPNALSADAPATVTLAARETTGVNEIEKIQFHIENVRFLAGDQALIVIKRSDVRNPKLRLGLLNLGDGKLRWPFGKTKEYALSDDNRYLAVRGYGGDLSVYDAGTDKTRTVSYRGALIPPPSMGFSAADALAFVTRTGKNKNNYSLNFQQMQSGASRELPFTLEPRYTVLSGAFSAVFDRNLFSFALRCRDLKSRRGSESLLIFDPETKTLKDISGDGRKFTELQYAGGFNSATLFYVAENDVPSKRRLRWYAGEKQGSFFPLRQSKLHVPSETLVLEGGDGLALLRLRERSLKNLEAQSFGFDVQTDAPNGLLVYSALQSTHFRLKGYDLGKQRPVEITAPEGDLIQPSLGTVRGVPQLAASRFHNERFTLAAAPLRLPGANLGAFKFYNRNDGWLFAPRFIAAPGTKGSTEFFADLYSNKSAEPLQAAKADAEAPEITVKQSNVPHTFRLTGAAAAVAFDGERLRYFLSLYATNLFNEKSFFANSILLSDELVSSVGFVDTNSGWGILGNFSDLEQTRTASLVLNRAFLLDEFREIDLYGEIETQEYAALNAATPAYVLPGQPGNLFYVGKTGIAYGFDEAVWDRHGPFSGKRLFVKGELGFNLESGELANADAVLDVRWYHALWTKLGLAHRLMAGVSRGDLPTVFFLGGNVSFRGVGFDDLQGNNYWVFSEDLRIPIFDVMGAKLPDPVDRVLGYFTRFFDVRGGFYGDTGAVWLEDAPYDPLYSIGYFFNIPTIFNLNFRFNQGLFGEDGIDIWLGSNW